MEQTKKLSKILIFIFNALLVMTPLLVILQWTLGADSIHSLSITGLFQETVETPEGIAKLSRPGALPIATWIGVLGSLCNRLAFFIGLLVLRTLFKRYKKGEIFSRANAKSYRKLSWLFFLNGLLTQPLAQMLFVLSATISNEPGHRYLQLTVGTPLFADIFCGLVLLAISLIMQEGTRLSDEHSLTV